MRENEDPEKRDILCNYLQREKLGGERGSFAPFPLKLLARCSLDRNSPQPLLSLSLSPSLRHKIRKRLGHPRRRHPLPLHGPLDLRRRGRRQGARGPPVPQDPLAARELPPGAEAPPPPPPEEKKSRTAARSSADLTSRGCLPHRPASSSSAYGVALRCDPCSPRSQT